MTTSYRCAIEIVRYPGTCAQLSLDLQALCETRNIICELTDELWLTREIVRPSEQASARHASGRGARPFERVGRKSGRIGGMFDQQHGYRRAGKICRPIPAAARSPLTQKGFERGVASHAVGRKVLLPRRPPNS